MKPQSVEPVETPTANGDDSRGPWKTSRQSHNCGRGAEVPSDLERWWDEAWFEQWERAARHQA